MLRNILNNKELHHQHNMVIKLKLIKQNKKNGKKNK
jgi:hypothetical protein